MIRFFTRRKSRPQPISIDDQLLLRAYRKRDFANWRSLREENRQFLQPWEPKWLDNELTFSSYIQRIENYEEQARQGSGICWLIWARTIPGTDENQPKVPHETLIGGISVTAIRRGASQSGIIGYWLGEQFTGQGCMKRSLTRVIGHCFDTLDLKRLEASCQAENLASRKVLSSCGFVEEGVARSLLCINGRRRDHIIYSLLSTDR